MATFLFDVVQVDQCFVQKRRGKTYLRGGAGRLIVGGAAAMVIQLSIPLNKRSVSVERRVFSRDWITTLGP